MPRVLFIAALLAGLLVAIYLALRFVARRRRARRLEAEYEAGEGRELTREDYVQRGLARFDRSASGWLALAILSVPVLVFVGLALLVEYT